MARGIMKPAVFQRILSETAKHVPPIRVAVLYHGGEPLMNKHFFEMARAVKNLGIPKVKTVSNGMLIREEIAEKFVNCGVDEIEISLDGDNKNTSNEIRRRSDANVIISNIKMLARAKEKSGAATSLTVSTTQFRLDEEAPKTPRWISDGLSDCPDILFKAVHAMQWPEWQPDDPRLSVGDAKAERPTSCDLIDDTISIRADGSVVICCYDLLGKSNLGNIMTSSLEEIWLGAHEDFRRRFSTGDYPKPCDTCAHVTGRRYLQFDDTAVARS